MRFSFRSHPRKRTLIRPFDYSCVSYTFDIEGDLFLGGRLIMQGWRRKPRAEIYSRNVNFRACKFETRWNSRKITEKYLLFLAALLGSIIVTVKNFTIFVNSTASSGTWKSWEILKNLGDICLKSPKVDKKTRKKSSFFSKIRNKTSQYHAFFPISLICKRIRQILRPRPEFRRFSWFAKKTLWNSQS